VEVGVLVVQVLGPVRVWRGCQLLDLGPAGRRAVFGLLAVSCGRPLARRELIDALWGDRPPPSATNVIQTHVKHLRRLLEPDRRARTPSAALPSVGDGYALDLPSGSVDVHRFREHTGLAAAAEQAGDHQRVVDLLGSALGWWAGHPLADVPLLTNHPPVLALVDERRAALARYVAAAMETGQAGRALPWLADDAATHPLDEATQALLVRAFAAAGQRDRAFATYDAARRLLADELGVGPGPELTAAYLGLLTDATAPVPPSAPPAGPATVVTTGPVDDPAPAAVNQLPGDVFGFAGRDAELLALDGLLATGSQTAVPIGVVSGTAGVGKTALAVRWAHRVRSRFPDGQLYLDLHGYDSQRPVPAGEALSRLLEALGVGGADIPLDVDARVVRFRAETADRRMLLLLDNAASVDQVRSLLPGTPTCLALVTSRNSLAGLVAVHGARRFDVDPLPADDAARLLHTLIGERVARAPEAAARLADQCARLPLALRVAAELAVARPAAELADLAAELVDRQRRLRLLDPGDDPRAAVRTVLSWSYLHLDPDAALAFRRLGLHPGPDFDAPAVAALTDSDLGRARRALHTLARNSLVHTMAGGRFGAHDLLRAYATELAEELDPAVERATATARLLDHHLAVASTAMDALFPAERPYRPRTGPVPAYAPRLTDADSARAWLSVEGPSLVAFCLYAAEHDRPGYAVDLAATLYRYLEGGRYTDALTMHTAALAAARRTGDPAMLGGALTNLGAMHRLLGNYGTASRHLRDAIALHERTGDRYGAARAMSNLGIVEERVGRYESAARYQHEALDMHRRLGNRYGEAATLLNLGNVYTRPGQYPRAAEYLAGALELFRELGDRVGAASALTNLGDVAASLGRYPDAASYLAEARDLFQASNHRYGEAVTLCNLGRMHTRIGGWREATQYLRTALEIFRGIGHRYGEASALNGLGETLHTAGRPEEARAAHTTALEIATGTGDDDEQDRARAGLARAGVSDLGRSGMPERHTSSKIR
jgi:DNA-binding SARP family transcriptional activator/tetratricopeptide (TPR) repeat protein